MYRLLSLLVLLLLSVSASAQPPATAEALLQRGQQVLARIEGDLALPGLKAPVEVRRDKWGVPHIYAQNADDLFFAQGVVVAQDRLFQIELWRRHAAGEMAEILGPQGLESDRFARLIRYRGDMKAEWDSYSPDTQAIATAFTRGINAYIDQLGDRLPIEFQLLGFRPKHWRPEDVLGRMSGIYMSQNFKNEVARAKLVSAVGIEKARWLAPVDPPRAYDSPVPLEELKAIDDRILAGFTAATKLLNFTPPATKVGPARLARPSDTNGVAGPPRLGGPTEVGPASLFPQEGPGDTSGVAPVRLGSADLPWTESNNWVVSGSRSHSGKPLLASDPHRAIALPSLRYLVHLNAPGWNVIGSGEPGLPGVALGHNDHIAWGFTIIGVDQADIFVEETKPDDPRFYKVGNRWEKMTTFAEEIAVKGKKDHAKVELRWTRHGPVLFQDEKTHRAYALKWAGHEPGGAAYLGSLAVSRARDKKSFLEAVKSWKVPGLNFVYADKEGETGWIAAALTPIRAKGDGLLPVPGLGRHDWTGFLPVSELPQEWNPKAGFVATANHNILPQGYRHTIGFEFAAPYRFHRLRSALGTQEKWELADFRALQHDDVSLPGWSLARLLRTTKFMSAQQQAYFKLLGQWDGKLDVNSRAGPIYALWLKELQDAVYSKHVPKELRSTLASLSGLPTLVRALEEGDRFWLGEGDKTARDELLRSALDRALVKLKALPEGQRERWGALHTVTFRHPLATLATAHEKAFNVGPFERSGEANTPNNTRYNEKFEQIHGASYRHLLDLADWDAGLATSTPGQSGQPGSLHYSDLAPLWARAEYFPLAFSRKKVEEVTRHRLVLKPRE